MSGDVLLCGGVITCTDDCDWGRSTLSGMITCTDDCDWGRSTVSGVITCTDDCESRRSIVIWMITCTDDCDWGREQSRGGTGVKVANVTTKTGKVAGARVIPPTLMGDLLIVTKNGQTIRTPLVGIKTSGRATQGVISYEI